jgi:cystathionine beta-lyase
MHPLRRTFHHRLHPCVARCFAVPPDSTAPTNKPPQKIKFNREDSTPDYNAIPTYPPRPSFESFHNPLQPLSQTVVYDGAPDDPYKPSSTPLYQTSTFQQPDATSFGKYDYTRSGNPTRTALEKQMAMLEGARAGFAFTSGMAALASMTRLLDNGEEMLVCDDVYGGMWRLLNKVTNRQGISHRFVDTSNVDAVVAALRPNTRLVHIETPSNPMMKITDLKALSDELRPRGVLLSVDATMMSPMMMRPLDLGVDIVVHSGTKFISGHADAMGGIMLTRDPTIEQTVAFFQNAEGSALAPFDCWLFLRGIKTLALRVERQCANARKVAGYLAAHEAVTTMYWPGKEMLGHPKSGIPDEQIQIHCNQTHLFEDNGGCSLVSFCTGSEAVSKRFVEACKILKITVSFGSCNSLVELPTAMSHASIDPELCQVPKDLVRISVGIESHIDIIQDIKQALAIAQEENQSGLLKETATVGGTGRVVVEEDEGRYDSKFEELPRTPAVNNTGSTNKE